MEKKYFGLVAERGAGKGLFIKLFRELYPLYRVGSVRFSDPLHQILMILNKERTRENLQILPTSLRTGFKDDGILNPAIKKLAQDSEANIVFLDGIRKAAEAEFARRELGAVIIYISADPKIRFERRRQDAENADERKMSWKKFLRLEKGAPEITIKTVGETMANVKIENNGTREEFKEKIKEFFEKYVSPELKR